ncbi:MAG: HDIG domain-containing metalloprotein [Bacteroidota bacterium]
MNDFASKLRNHYALLYKMVLFVLAVVILLFIFPKEAKFKYDYHNGKPWMHADLIAPFDFAILKPDSQLNAEKSASLKNFKPYFSKNNSISLREIEKCKEEFSQHWAILYKNTNLFAFKQTEQNISDLLSRFYNNGIIENNPEIQNKPPDFIFIQINDDKVAEEHFLNEVYTLSSAQEEIKLELFGNKSLDSSFYPIIQRHLVENIKFEVEKTQTDKQSLLSLISPTYGLIQKGEKIISKGEILNSPKFLVIESLRRQYEKQTDVTHKSILLILGQVILISMSMTVFALFLYAFRRDIYNHNKKLVFLLMLIIMMVGITSVVANNYVDYLYMVPICMVPLLVRVFFDTRLALFVHLITIILIGFLVPNSFEFLFLQLIAGIITIISVVNLHRRSQFFLTSFLILLTYNITHLGIVLIEDASIQKILLSDVAMFAVSAITTLLAYPLIYMFEKIFGFVTNVSLLELADTNNTLLRKLSMLAPGTFQHSLQVANLAEEAVYSVGGNPLLVRVGALYHDIGKIEMPQYFIENQSSGMNPHSEITPLESAQILIQHVIRGIEIARKHKVPEQIIDFIRTHHGTKKTEYFYNQYKIAHPNEPIDEARFTYRGPVPVSLETCILMMADSVEAASRSLTQPDEEKINNLVESVTNRQLENDQFIHAEISFRDINQIKKIFKQKLLNIYHIRISYPEI